MALYLDVPYQSQDSPMSCWWAAIRMTLRYAGGSAPGNPSSYSPAFGDRRPSSVLTDRARRTLTLPRPGEWYQTGVPPLSIMIDSSQLESLFDPTRGVLRGVGRPNDSRLLSRIDQRIVGSGFQHTISPSLREITRYSSVVAPRRWTVSSLESMLRAHGPIVQFSTLRSENGSYGHAFVIVGVGGNEAYIHDPAAMSWLPVSIEWLNGVITSLQADLIGPSFALPVLAHPRGGSINRVLQAPKQQGS